MNSFKRKSYSQNRFNLLVVENFVWTLISCFREFVRRKSFHSNKKSMLILAQERFKIFINNIVSWLNNHSWNLDNLHWDKKRNLKDWLFSLFLIHNNQSLHSCDQMKQTVLAQQHGIANKVRYSIFKWPHFASWMAKK